MKIEEIAVKLTAKFERGAYRGEVNGYEFQICSINAGFGIKQYYMAFILDRSLEASEMKAIRQEVGATGLFFTSAVHLNNTVLIFVRNPLKGKERARKLTSYFKDRSFKIVSKDIYGSNEEITNHKTISIKIQTGLKFNLVVPINEAIYKEKHQQEIAKIINEEKGNNNKVGGIIFAVIGAILGSIPSLIAYELGFMSWWLYIIVPFASFYSYKNAKGPLHRLVPLIIGVITVVVSLSMFLYTWANLAFYNDMTLGILLSDKKILPLFLSDLVFLLIGNLVGILFSAKIIYNKTTASKLKDLEENQ
ncbi:hypothetical protein [Acholeplasma laidlawii]|uniref:hypothetical protein n=1 Tax=Acholeplasma laidlawii TaxID=2148 RepID=UPI00084C82FE|nr:hypothetical protein [Acholeplasma laidlawii]OED58965.1 hypothetical protein BHS12_05615 [Acholeplasma laidlawii]